MKKTAMPLTLVIVLLVSACGAKEQTPTSTSIPAAVEATAVPATATAAEPTAKPTAEPTSAPTTEPTSQPEVATVDEAPAPGNANAILVEALMNATYSGIYEEPVTLTDGFFEDQPFTVEYLDGSELYTDLDGDGAEDAVVFLLERGGGTANIIYMAAQLNLGSQPVDAGAVRLDEVRIKSAAVEDGQIQLEIIAIGPGDGDCCPTHKTSKTYAYQDGQLVDVSAEEGEWVQVSADDLNGTSWTLLELNYDTPMPADAEVTISFQDGQITGYGGCNDYNSSFTLGEDNPFVMTTSPVVSTKKACPDPILDQEVAYLTALDNVSQWGYEFGHLVLYYLDEEGVPARLLFAPASDGEAAIGANPWQWVSFTSPVEQFDVEMPESYLITFNEDGTVNIVADCNNAMGSYTDEDGALAIALGPMTAVACPDGSRSDQFVTLLGAAARYFFADGGLFIDLMADGGTMRLDTAGAAAAAVADQAAAAQAKLVASLTANPWKWTTAISPAEVVTVETPASYMVTFKDDGTVDIQADCNDATGMYTLDGSKVTIEVGAATLVACPGDSRSEQFLQLLGEASELLPQPGQLIVGLETEGSAMLFDGLLTIVVDLCGEEALAINIIEDTLAPEISAQLDQRLTSLVQDKPRPGPGGVMMIITPQGRYFKSIGVADVTSCEPLAADSPYQIGSNTKMMTTAILLQLQEEGVLSITDPLSKWLPELAAKLPNGDKITIDMLLTHTSGLHDYFDGPTEGGSIEDGVIDKAMLTRAFTPEELVRIVADSGLVDFEPGAEGQWHYSNTGYILLGLIIEKATGMSYEENLEERIFEPLGLKQTYLQTDVPEPGALPQAYVRSPFDFTTGEWNASQGWSAGAVVSTPEEFALFLKALFTAKLFKDPATLDLMKQHTSAGVDALGPGTVYAHGMLDNNGVLGHGGQTLGFQSDGGYIPDKDVTIVLWSNAMESNVSRSLVPVIAAMIAGDEQAAQLATLAPPP